MLTRRDFAIALAAPVLGRSATSHEAILAEASKNALTWVRDLPDFLCTETIRRSDNIRGSGWRVKDVLGVQVGISGKREYYKLLTLNGRPSTLDYRKVGGALTEGEWGSLPAEIFRPRAARFEWKGETEVRGRRAYTFRYRVPPENATFHLEFGYRSGKPQATVVGHRGMAWIDRETLQVVRLEQAAEIPKDFPLKVSKTTLDYAWADIAGANCLLPVRAVVTMGTREILTRNEVEFGDYRRFASDSRIAFEDPV
jgi:hypothetical protein